MVGEKKPRKTKSGTTEDPVQEWRACGRDEKHREPTRPEKPQEYPNSYPKNRGGGERKRAAGLIYQIEVSDRYS